MRLSCVCGTPLSHETSCHPSPQKQIGTPAQLREPTRTPLLYSRPVTRSPRKTPEGAKREEGGENAVIFLWGCRATRAPLSPQAIRAIGPKLPRIPHSSLPMADIWGSIPVDPPTVKQIIQAVDIQLQTTHNQSRSQPARTAPPVRTRA